MRYTGIIDVFNKFILGGNEKSWETGNFSFVISTTYDNKSIKK